MERTLLKETVVDPALHSSVNTMLDMMFLPPSVDVCKAEIRKAGAKLKSKRKRKAVRSARMIQQGEWPDEELNWELEQRGALDDEMSQLIAAISAKKRLGNQGESAQQAHNPWNLPKQVWSVTGLPRP